jgi:hypothetical protein
LSPIAVPPYHHSIHKNRQLITDRRRSSTQIDPIFPVPIDMLRDVRAETTQRFGIDGYCFTAVPCMAASGLSICMKTTCLPLSTIAKRTTALDSGISVRRRMPVQSAFTV